MNSNFIWGRADEARHRAFSRTDLAALIGVVALLTFLLLPPISQDPGYHNFADHRTIWGVPNFWNVGLVPKIETTS